MTPDKKKQLPQLIILGVLAVFCVCYISFSLVGGGKKTPPPAPEREAAEGDTNEQARVTVNPELRPTVEFPDLTITPARRDPFMQQPAGASEIASAQASEPRRFTDQPARVVSNPNRSIPRFDLGPVNPFSQSSGPVYTPPAGSTQTSDPEFQLTGVIRGAENIAIIRVGEKGRHIVKEGQLIEGRYRVLSVSDDGAVLVDGNRRIHVKLGGVKNAS